jgi:hypothetical protein
VTHGPTRATGGAGSADGAFPPGGGPAAPPGAGAAWAGAPLRWAGAGVLLAAAFAADQLTGSEASSSLYYIIAVAYAAWFLGRPAGLGMAALSTVAWYAAYELAGRPFSHPAILLWNLLAEISVYAAMALSLGFLRDHVAKVRALAVRLSEANDRLDREALAVGRLQRDLLPG